MVELFLFTPLLMSVAGLPSRCTFTGRHPASHHQPGHRALAHLGDLDHVLVHLRRQRLRHGRWVAIFPLCVSLGSFPLGGGVPCFPLGGGSLVNLDHVLVHQRRQRHDTEGAPWFGVSFRGVFPIGVSHWGFCVSHWGCFPLGFQVSFF